MPFRREIKWLPGFDHRDDPERRHLGCHGLEVRWLLHGGRGTVEFIIYTPWLPTWRPHARTGLAFVTPAYVGYHTPAPTRPGQEPSGERCDYHAGPCYGDGSFTLADDVFKLLVSQGEEAVWEFLEGRYAEWIAGSEVSRPGLEPQG